MSSAASGTLPVMDILQHFERDPPKRRSAQPSSDLIEGRIDGCTAVSLQPASDRRGDLFELLTTRDYAIEPIVHVYQVFCEPGSIRAWVYHSEQTDRLCYTEGMFRIALCDLRPDSSTAGNIVSFIAGADAPTLLHIPPFVAHGVQNLGPHRTPFLNLPTRAYRHEHPDKYRIPFNSPLIPFTW